MTRETAPAAERATGPDAAGDGAQPLVPASRERFAQAFATTQCGAEAARLAGYGRHATSAWVALLQKRSVQARLCFLKRAPDQPAARARDPEDALREIALLDVSTLYRFDPLTGAPTLDLARASQAQLSALEVTQTSVVQDGRTRRTMRIRTPDRVGAAKALMSREPSARDTHEARYRDELMRAARNINAASPPLDPDYVRANAHRLRDLAD
jgi:phage terminase small subunit